MLDFEKIKSYYISGYWNKEMVRKAAEKGVITAKQAEEITGVLYLTAEDCPWQE